MTKRNRDNSKNKDNMDIWDNRDNKDNRAGFSIEGGTRRLIAAYFGIYSRLLCV